MSITGDQYLGDKIQPFAPSPQSSGLSFLDQLGGAFASSIPGVLDNLTRRNPDPGQPEIVEDQTHIEGDARLTQTDPSFLEKNWKYLGAGAIALIGVIALVKK